MIKKKESISQSRNYLQLGSNLPEAQRHRLRTSNACENLNRQVRRRTAVAGLFPNEASLLRLVSAILMEISEDWETSKCYLSLPPPLPLKS